MKKKTWDSKLPSTPRRTKSVGVGGTGTGTGNGTTRTINSESSPNAKPASPQININSAANQKLNEINAILSQPEIDLWALRELCLTEGGLINGKLHNDILNRSF